MRWHAPGALSFKGKRNRIEDLYAAHCERREASGKPVIWQTA